MGLVAPHMARRLIGGRHHAFMPASMLLGALLLLLADTLGRSAFQPREIPVGIVISVLSAPYFLFLLRRYFLREDVYAFTYAGKGFVCRI